MQSPTPDLHILGHWTYPAGTKKTVYVIANHCDTVELLLNGKSLGTISAPMDGDVYAFPDVAFAPGVLRAVARQGGRAVAEQPLKTAGEAKALRLTLQTGPGGLRADGADVALVDFEVVDAEGNRCPTDEARVDFAIDGPVTWRGGLNAAKPNSTNNLYLDTECGINRVALRSTLKPGKITLTASRPGLASATVTLEAKPVAVGEKLAP
jgi:beta-galactosidase